MGRKSSKIAVIAAVTTLWPVNASSQQGGVQAAGGAPQQAAPAKQPVGGLQYDLSLSFTGRYDDNYSLTSGASPGDSYFFDTGLGFNISSVTRAYSLNLGGAGILRYGDIPGRSLSGFEEPIVNFAFATDSPNSRFGTDFRYRQVDREFIDPFRIEREEQTSNGLIDDGGDLRQLSGGLLYETGINGPVTTLLSYRLNNKSYSNVTDPRLFGTDQDTYQGTVTLRVDPLTRLRLNAGLTDYVADDTVQTDRRTTDYSVGVVRNLDKSLVFDAQIGYTSVDTERLTGNTEDSGLTGALGLTKTLRDGSVFGALSSSRNQNGERTTLRFGRDIQFKNGSLNGALGLTRGETDSTDWIGTLAYTHQIRTNSFTFALSRNVTTNNTDEDLLNTRLSVGYGYTINSASRLDLTVDWGRSEDGGVGSAPTVDRTNLRATYTHQLTADWNLQGGYVWRERSETGLQDATSNSVFVTLARNFSFRP